MNGEEIGLGRCEETVAGRFDIGEDTGTPVSEGYRVPYRFQGSIERVTVTLKK